MAANGFKPVKIEGAKQVKRGIYLSDGQMVVFGVSSQNTDSYIFAYRHRNHDKPFAVVGKFLEIYQGKGAMSLAKSADLKEGEKILYTRTGPSNSIKTFYKFWEISSSEMSKVLRSELMTID